MLDSPGAHNLLAADIAHRNGMEPGLTGEMKLNFAHFEQLLIGKLVQKLAALIAQGEELGLFSLAGGSRLYLLMQFDGIIRSPQGVFQGNPYAPA